jgi:hypothetical protein
VCYTDVVKNIKLHSISTYEGFAGSRYADIAVSSEVQAGALEPLVTYLNSEAQLRAVPAYDEYKNQHILRLSGFSDDAQLKALLSSGFEAWQAQQGVTDGVSIAMVEPQAQHDTVIQHTNNFIKDHATTLAGLSYVSGNLGILYSAMTATPEHCDITRRRDVDWMKVYSSVAYNLASGILLALAPSIDAERSPDAIAKDAAERAFRPPSEGAANMVEQAINFVRKHPWEVSATLSLSGSAAYLATVAKRYHNTRDAGLIYEGLSVLGSITGMTITLLMPDPKEAPPANYPQESLSDTASRMADNLPKDRPSLGQRIKDFTTHITTHPLLLASVFHGGANVMRTTAAFKKEHKDAGLFFASGAYMTGNIMQAQGRKSKAADLQDVVKASANLLRNDPAYAYETEAQLAVRIDRMAEELSGMHDITEQPTAIKKLLTEQVQHSNLSALKLGADNVPKSSPFCASSLTHVQRLQQQSQGAAGVSVSSNF